MPAISATKDAIDLNTMFGPLPASASDLLLDDLTGMMKAHGLRACCVMSTIGVLLDHMTGNTATRVASSENRALLPVATINPQVLVRPDTAVSALRGEGFRMVRFFPAIQGWEPDYLPFLEMAEACDAAKLPVMVRIERPGLATRMLRALPSTPVPLILEGITEHTVSEAACLARRYANVYVETSGLVSLGGIRHLVDAIGADRVLFGSGAPGRPMAAGLIIMCHSGLSDDQVAQVEGGNARRILGL